MINISLDHFLSHYVYSLFTVVCRINTSYYTPLFTRKQREEEKKRKATPLDPPMTGDQGRTKRKEEKKRKPVVDTMKPVPKTGVKQITTKQPRTYNNTLL